MKRLIITLGVVLLALIVATAVWFFVIRPRTLVTDESQNGISAVGTLPQSANTGGVGEPVNNGFSGSAGAAFEEEIARKELTSRSRVFVQRIGSYSSHGTLSNMIDLYADMTETLRLTTEENRQRIEREFKERTTFIGFAIHPVTIIIEDLNLASGSARARIIAQRETTNELDEILTTQESYMITWQRQENEKWLAHEFEGNY